MPASIKKGFASLLFFCSLSLAQTPIKIFLLAGQSNMSGYTPVAGTPASLAKRQANVLVYMDGDALPEKELKWLPDSLGFGLTPDYFGPEVTFGLTLTDSLPGIKFGLVKYAVGGAGLYNYWRPPSSGGEKGIYYTQFMKHIDAALASLGPAYAPQIVGMLWMQGETDAYYEDRAHQYEANLTNFIHDVRGELGMPTLPFILGKIDSVETWRFNGPVRAAQTNVAKNGANVAVFDTHGYSTDSTHYKVEGMMRLGQDFAKTYLASFKSIVLSASNDETTKPGRFAITFDARGRALILTLPVMSYHAPLDIEIMDLQGRQIAMLRSHSLGGRVRIESARMPGLQRLEGLAIARVRFGGNFRRQPLLFP